jgi:hypothetical protein
MLRALILVLLLASCGRALTENERAFLSTIHGDTLNMDAVRLHDGAPTRAVTFRRKPRPRTTCRELILPPPTDEIVTTKPAAVAVYNTILFDKDWFLEDYLPDYPDTIGIIAAMLFAHELTHVWQWPPAIRRCVPRQNMAAGPTPICLKSTPTAALAISPMSSKAPSWRNMSAAVRWPPRHRAPSGCMR